MGRRARAISLRLGVGGGDDGLRVATGVGVVDGVSPRILHGENASPPIVRESSSAVRLTEVARTMILLVPPDPSISGGRSEPAACRGPARLVIEAWTMKGDAGSARRHGRGALD